MQSRSSAALSSAERRVATGYSDAVGAWLEFANKLYAAQELPKVVTADLQGGTATGRKMEEELLVNTSQPARGTLQRNQHQIGYLRSGGVFKLSVTLVNGQRTICQVVFWVQHIDPREE